VHAQHSTDHQLKETETSTQNDTVIFGPMSPEKPNAGKPVQLPEGFIIKQLLPEYTGCQTGYPTEIKIWQQYLSSEAGIRKAFSTKSLSNTI